MMNEKDTRRIMTPWGKEVKKRLLDRDMSQDDLVNILVHNGFKIAKWNLSDLIYGIGAPARIPEIKAINQILGIEMKFNEK